MAVTVRPEKLREALGAKLATAVQALYELREADKPMMNRIWEPQNVVVEFLHAAHGVYPIVKTFGEENLQPAGFRQWVDGWKSGLSATNRHLWQQMNTERVAQEHGEGADLIPHQIEISQIDNRSFKGGVRFAAYPDRPVSEVCAEYFDLCQRFGDDFRRDHAHLIP
jgi:hypothetical protein